jgi:hypothetical protein
MFQKLESENVLRNTYKIHPLCSWYIFGGKKYYNRNVPISGTIAGNKINQYETGDTAALRLDRPEALDELNVDRDSTTHSILNPTLIYPFMVSVKDNYYFQNVSDTDSYALKIGDTMVGEYPLLSNIALDLYPVAPDPLHLTDPSRYRIKALKNVFDIYKIKNVLFNYDLIETKPLRLVSIPEIFYGSQIQPGTVRLDFYTGGGRNGENRTFIGRLTDSNSDGILYQSEGYDDTHDGDAAGYVLYDEGFLVLFGDWDISGGVFTDVFLSEVSNFAQQTPKWWVWGGGTAPFKSAYEIFFNGTQSVNNLTMMLECDGLNYSNNPSYLSGIRTPEITEGGFIESTNGAEICNTVYSQFGTDAPFRPQVFITKIGVFDEERKLIGIVKTAQPIKMFEGRKVMFKVSLDI